MIDRRPSVFVGLSGNDPRVEQIVEACLGRVADLDLWDRGFLGLTDDESRTLVGRVGRSDLAVVVFGSGSTEGAGAGRRDRQLSARDHLLAARGWFDAGLGWKTLRPAPDSPAEARALPEAVGAALVGCFGPIGGELPPALWPACAQIRRQVEELEVRRSPAASDLGELARLGQRLIVEKIRPTLAEGDVGKFIAVDTDSEDYEVDANDHAAVSRLKGRRPSASMWLGRVGEEAAYRMRSAR